MTLNEQRKQIGEWLKGPNGGQLWDLLCSLRGPDSPSERGDMTSAESSRAYQGRRDRKRETVEVIREKAFFGVIGGAARHHDADYVILPPSSQWDHFDKHVSRAAEVLGLEVRMKKVEAGAGTEVKVKMMEAVKPLVQFPSFVAMGQFGSVAHCKAKLEILTKFAQTDLSPYTEQQIEWLKGRIAYFTKLIAEKEKNGK